MEHCCKFANNENRDGQDRPQCTKPEYQLFASVPNTVLYCMFKKDECPFFLDKITLDNINGALEKKGVIIK